MFLTAFFFPSLPVLLAAVMALPVFALTALLSKKATERLAKEQGEPSDIEAGFYWLHMVSKWGAIALLPYLFIVGLVWIAMNDNASRIFNQAFTVIFDQALTVIVILGAVVIVPLAAVSITAGLTLLTAMVLSNVAIMAPFWFSEKQMKTFTRCLAVTRVATVVTALVFAITFFAVTVIKLIQS